MGKNSGSTRTRDHRGEKNPFWQHHHTVESKEKISRSQRCRHCILRQIAKANKLRLENLRRAQETDTL